MTGQPARTTSRLLCEALRRQRRLEAKLASAEEQLVTQATELRRLRGIEARAVELQDQLVAARGGLEHQSSLERAVGHLAASLERLTLRYAREQRRNQYLAERGKDLARALRMARSKRQEAARTIKPRRPPWYVRASITLAQPAWVREAIKPGGLIG